MKEIRTFINGSATSSTRLISEYHSYVAQPQNQTPPPKEEFSDIQCIVIAGICGLVGWGILGSLQDRNHK